MSTRLENPQPPTWRPLKSAPLKFTPNFVPQVHPPFPYDFRLCGDLVLGSCLQLRPRPPQTTLPPAFAHWLGDLPGPAVRPSLRVALRDLGAEAGNGISPRRERRSNYKAQTLCNRHLILTTTCNLFILHFNSKSGLSGLTRPHRRHQPA